MVDNVFRQQNIMRTIYSQRILLSDWLGYFTGPYYHVLFGTLIWNTCNFLQLVHSVQCWMKNNAKTVSLLALIIREPRVSDGWRNYQCSHWVDPPDTAMASEGKTFDIQPSLKSQSKRVAAFGYVASGILSPWPERLYNYQRH